MPAAYSVPLASGASYTAQSDFLQVVQIQNGVVIEVVAFHIAVISEVQQAQEEWLRIGIFRGATTVSAGGIPERPVDEFTTANHINTFYGPDTIATGGTEVLLWADAMNVRQRYERRFPKGEGPRSAANAAAGGIIAIRMLSTPADAIQFEGTAYVLATRE